jgi:hypothetical protein
MAVVAGGRGKPIAGKKGLVRVNAGYFYRLAEQPPLSRGRYHVSNKITIGA